MSMSMKGSLTDRGKWQCGIAGHGKLGADVWLESSEEGPC